MAGVLIRIPQFTKSHRWGSHNADGSIPLQQQQQQHPHVRGSLSNAELLDADENAGGVSFGQTPRAQMFSTSTLRKSNVVSGSANQTLLKRSSTVRASGNPGDLSKTHDRTNAGTGAGVGVGTPAFQEESIAGERPPARSPHTSVRGGGGGAAGAAARHPPSSSFSKRFSLPSALQPENNGGLGGRGCVPFQAGDNFYIIIEHPRNASIAAARKKREGEGKELHTTLGFSHSKMTLSTSTRASTNVNSADSQVSSTHGAADVIASGRVSENARNLSLSKKSTSTQNQPNSSTTVSSTREEEDAALPQTLSASSRFSRVWTSLRGKGRDVNGDAAAEGNATEGQVDDEHASKGDILDPYLFSVVTVETESGQLLYTGTPQLDLFSSFEDALLSLESVCPVPGERGQHSANAMWLHSVGSQPNRFLEGESSPKSHSKKMSTHEERNEHETPMSSFLRWATSVDLQVVCEFDAFAGGCLTKDALHLLFIEETTSVSAVSTSTANADSNSASLTRAVKSIEDLFTENANGTLPKGEGNTQRADPVKDVAEQIRRVQRAIWRSFPLQLQCDALQVPYSYSSAESSNRSSTGRQWQSIHEAEKYASLASVASTAYALSGDCPLGSCLDEYWEPASLTVKRRSSVYPFRLSPSSRSLSTEPSHPKESATSTQLSLNRSLPSFDPTTSTYLYFVPGVDLSHPASTKAWMKSTANLKGMLDSRENDQSRHESLSSRLPVSPQGHTRPSAELMTASKSTMGDTECLWNVELIQFVETFHLGDWCCRLALGSFTCVPQLPLPSQPAHATSTAPAAAAAAATNAAPLAGVAMLVRISRLSEEGCCTGDFPTSFGSNERGGNEDGTPTLTQLLEFRSFDRPQYTSPLEAECQLFVFSRSPARASSSSTEASGLKKRSTAAKPSTAARGNGSAASNDESPVGRRHSTPSHSEESTDNSVQNDEADDESLTEDEEDGINTREAMGTDSANGSALHSCNSLPSWKEPDVHGDDVINGLPRTAEAGFHTPRSHGGVSEAYPEANGDTMADVPQPKTISGSPEILARLDGTRNGSIRNALSKQLQSTPSLEDSSTDKPLLVKFPAIRGDSERFNKVTVESFLWRRGGDFANHPDKIKSDVHWLKSGNASFADPLPVKESRVATIFESYASRFGHGTRILLHHVGSVGSPVAPSQYSAIDSASRRNAGQVDPEHIVLGTEALITLAEHSQCFGLRPVPEFVSLMGHHLYLGCSTKERRRRVDRWWSSRKARGDTALAPTHTDGTSAPASARVVGDQTAQSMKETTPYPFLETTGGDSGDAQGNAVRRICVHADSSIDRVAAAVTSVFWIVQWLQSCLSQEWQSARKSKSTDDSAAAARKKSLGAVVHSAVALVMQSSLGKSTTPMSKEMFEGVIFPTACACILSSLEGADEGDTWYCDGPAHELPVTIAQKIIDKHHNALVPSQARPFGKTAPGGGASGTGLLSPSRCTPPRDNAESDWSSHELDSVAAETEGAWSGRLGAEMEAFLSSMFSFPSIAPFPPLSTAHRIRLLSHPACGAAIVSLRAEAGGTAVNVCGGGEEGLNGNHRGGGSEGGNEEEHMVGGGSRRPPVTQTRLPSESLPLLEEWTALIHPKTCPVLAPHDVDRISFTVALPELSYLSQIVVSIPNAIQETPFVSPLAISAACVSAAEITSQGTSSIGSRLVFDEMPLPIGVYLDHGESAAFQTVTSSRATSQLVSFAFPTPWYDSDSNAHSGPALFSTVTEGSPPLFAAAGYSFSDRTPVVARFVTITFHGPGYNEIAIPPVMIFGEPLRCIPRTQRHSVLGSALASSSSFTQKEALAQRLRSNLIPMTHGSRELSFRPAKFPARLLEILSENGFGVAPPLDQSGSGTPSAETRAAHMGRQTRTVNAAVSRNELLREVIEENTLMYKVQSTVPTQTFRANFHLAVSLELLRLQSGLPKGFRDTCLAKLSLPRWMMNPLTHIIPLSYFHASAKPFSAPVDVDGLNAASRYMQLPALALWTRARQMSKQVRKDNVDPYTSLFSASQDELRVVQKQVDEYRKRHCACCHRKIGWFTSSKTCELCEQVICVKCMNTEAVPLHEVGLSNRTTVNSGPSSLSLSVWSTWTCTDGQHHSRPPTLAQLASPSSNSMTLVAPHALSYICKECVPKAKEVDELMFQFFVQLHQSASAREIDGNLNNCSALYLRPELFAMKTECHIRSEGVPQTRLTHTGIKNTIFDSIDHSGIGCIPLPTAAATPVQATEETEGRTEATVSKLSGISWRSALRLRSEAPAVVRDSEQNKSSVEKRATLAAVAAAAASYPLTIGGIVRVVSEPPVYGICEDDVDSQGVMSETRGWQSSMVDANTASVAYINGTSSVSFPFSCILGQPQTRGFQEIASQKEAARDLSASLKDVLVSRLSMDQPFWRCVSREERGISAVATTRHVVLLLPTAAFVDHADIWFDYSGSVLGAPEDCAGSVTVELLVGDRVQTMSRAASHTLRFKNVYGDHESSVNSDNAEKANETNCNMGKGKVRVSWNAHAHHNTTSTARVPRRLVMLRFTGTTDDLWAFKVVRCMLNGRFSRPTRKRTESLRESVNSSSRYLTDSDRTRYTCYLRMPTVSASLVNSFSSNPWGPSTSTRSFLSAAPFSGVAALASASPGAGGIRGGGSTLSASPVIATTNGSPMLLTSPLPRTLQMSRLIRVKAVHTTPATPANSDPNFPVLCQQNSVPFLFEYDFGSAATVCGFTLEQHHPLYVTHAHSGIVSSLRFIAVTENGLRSTVGVFPMPWPPLSAVASEGHVPVVPSFSYAFPVPALDVLSIIVLWDEQRPMSQLARRKRRRGRGRRVHTSKEHSHHTSSAQLKDYPSEASNDGTRALKGVSASMSTLASKPTNKPRTAASSAVSFNAGGRSASTSFRAESNPSSFSKNSLSRSSSQRPSVTASPRPSSGAPEQPLFLQRKELQQQLERNPSSAGIISSPSGSMSNRNRSKSPGYTASSRATPRSEMVSPTASLDKPPTAPIAAQRRHSSRKSPSPSQRQKASTSGNPTAPPLRGAFFDRQQALEETMATLRHRRVATPYCGRIQFWTSTSESTRLAVSSRLYESAASSDAMTSTDAALESPFCSPLFLKRYR